MKTKKEQKEATIALSDKLSEKIAEHPGRGMDGVTVSCLSAIIVKLDELLDGVDELLNKNRGR